MTIFENIRRRRAEFPLREPEDDRERQRGSILADVFEAWGRSNAARFEPRKRGLFGRHTPFRCLYQTDDVCLLELARREAAIPEGVAMITVQESIACWERDPDAMASLYPVVVSYFTPGLPTAHHQRATARHPIRPDEQYYLHIRGLWTSPSSGTASDDLWKAGPAGMTLLAPRFTRWRG